MLKTHEMSDEELVEIVRSQDKEAYRELVERYQDRLFRYARYLVRDYDRAHDVVQESFVKAFVNLNSFRSDKKFSSWIYRIVHNEAINLIRKHKKEVSLEDGGEAFLMPADDNTHADAEAAEMATFLREKLDDLPFEYREPLILFFLEDLPYEEIGDVLRLPVNTVGTRIRRGKTLLKSLYTSKGGEQL